MWTCWENFDKKMCGKWVSNKLDINNNDVVIFLNILYLNEEVVVSFSYNYSSFNNKMFYVEYSDNVLYCFHNDFAHRAEYILKIENDDLLKCKFSIKNCYGLNGKMNKEFEFKRYENLTEAEIKKFDPSYIIESKDAERIDILNEYAEYGDYTFDFKYNYKFDERENLLDFIKENNLDQIVQDKNDVETAIALMNWVCKHYKHGNPPSGLPNKRTPQALIKASESFENRTNCRGLSLILAQLIRAYNITAFHVTCMPYEEPFYDCHVVVCVYCKSLNKYIMLDPTSNLYIKNKFGVIVDIAEFRDLLIKDEAITLNDDYFNHLWSIDGYRDYMAKNLIRIERYINNSFGVDGQGGIVVLVPDKYYENEAKKIAGNDRKSYITSKNDFWKLN